MTALSIIFLIISILAWINSRLRLSSEKNNISSLQSKVDTLSADLKRKNRIITENDDRIKHLEDSLNKSNDALKKIREKTKETEKAGKCLEYIQKDIEEKRAELKSLEKKHNDLCHRYRKENDDARILDQLEMAIKKARAELEKLTLECIIESYNFSDYDGITSEECKNNIAILKLEEKALIKNGSAIILASKPDTKGEKKIYNENTKQILRCFNTECDNILLSVNARNIDTMRAKMQRSFETLNKIFEVDGVRIDVALLEIKLNELNLVHTAALKAEAEREEQKAIKAQMLEEEKVRREIEKEKQKLEKEEHQFKNEISKLMKYMQKASDIEKQLYIDKINELEGKLKLLEKDRENVLEREQNTRAGFVYVISNIGSFGENVYKIGMTRRLEPMDRVKELGDASVPFEFDVHAMIFSEDAPKLENILHETFRKYQVNKVNNRKEFFKVPLEEIETVVRENHNATVTFTMVAKAEQYRESLRLAGK